MWVAADAYIINVKHGDMCLLADAGKPFFKICPPIKDYNPDDIEDGVVTFSTAATVCIHTTNFHRWNVNIYNRMKNCNEINWAVTAALFHQYGGYCPRHRRA